LGRKRQEEVYNLCHHVAAREPIGQGGRGEKIAVKRERCARGRKRRKRRVATKISNFPEKKEDYRGAKKTGLLEQKGERRHVTPCQEKKRNFPASEENRSVPRRKKRMSSQKEK